METMWDAYFDRGVQPLIMAKQHRIATVTDCGDDSINAVRARLIAAAPDLYEALDEVMTVLRKEAPGTPLNNHRFDALGMKAHAALKKARGE